MHVMLAEYDYKKKKRLGYQGEVLQGVGVCT